MLSNIIAAGILAVCVVLAVGFLIRRHIKAAQSGAAPGCVGCSGCSGCSSCSSSLPGTEPPVKD